jgi:hypothetical protein
VANSANKIEITSEMIGAGLKVYLDWIPDDAPRWPQDEANLMARIFRAMYARRPESQKSSSGRSNQDQSMRRLAMVLAEIEPHPKAFVASLEAELLRLQLPPLSRG